MAIPDNYIDKITKGNDSRMISPAAGMVRVDNDNFDGETLDEVLDDVAQDISDKANTADVYTKSEVDTKVEEAGSGAVSVTTNQDGTFVIHVGSTNYTVNLNHTHENMAKIVKCTEATLPQTFADDTIYVQVDSANPPTEIEKLYLFGLEFTGGGIPDTGEPIIISPYNGTEINIGENDGSGVSKTIIVKGKNLTGDITVVASTGLTLSYGQSTGQSSVTIPMAQALLGAQVTIAYSGSGALNDGSLVISHGGSVLSSVVVVVVVEYFPAGYTRLNSISGITDFITTNINSNGTTWEFDVVTHQDGNQTQILAGYGSAGAGQYGGACINGKWGLGVTDNLCTTVPYTTRSKIVLSFTTAQASMTIGEQTITRATASASSGDLELLGFHTTYHNDNYKIRGTIYSVKCIAGASFDGVPAERNSDNKQGIYDLANDVFYPLK